VESRLALHFERLRDGVVRSVDHAHHPGAEVRDEHPSTVSARRRAVRRLVYLDESGLADLGHGFPYRIVVTAADRRWLATLATGGVIQEVVGSAPPSRHE